MDHEIPLSSESILQLLPEFDRNVGLVLSEIMEILHAKNELYGSNNLTKHGPIGILIRMDDKIARLTNLIKEKGTLNSVSEHHYNATEDACRDLIGYATLYIMYMRGQYGE